MSKALLQMYRGGDVSFRMIWPGDNGQPFDLTGWTVAAFEPHERLIGNIALEISDAAAGEVTGAIEWDDSYTNGAVMGFRVLLTQGEVQMSMPELVVNVK